MQQSSVRLNKFLARHGYDARRKIARFLHENEVKINKVIVKEPGIRLDPTVDQVYVNGRLLKEAESLVYFLLNKPKGVISSVKDEYGRQTVADLIPDQKRIYPVGRLDENTKGALILTNDGTLANQLTHPSHHIGKTYVCLVTGKVKDWQIKSLQAGIDLKDGQKTSPAKVKVLEEKPNRTLLQLVIHEGKNHQVKRMLSKVKLELIELKRTAIGKLELGDLESGKWRKLTKSEILLLKK